MHLSKLTDICIHLLLTRRKTDEVQLTYRAMKVLYRPQMERLKNDIDTIDKRTAQTSSFFNSYFICIVLFMFRF